MVRRFFLVKMLTIRYWFGFAKTQARRLVSDDVHAHAPDPLDSMHSSDFHPSIVGSCRETHCRHGP